MTLCYVQQSLQRWTELALLKGKNFVYKMREALRRRSRGAVNIGGELSLDDGHLRMFLLMPVHIQELLAGVR